ncbi:MAG: hypothetical protein V4710_05595 [Verrucomicrobiota bacterium]
MSWRVLSDFPAACFVRLAHFGCLLKAAASRSTQHCSVKVTGFT